METMELWACEPSCHWQLYDSTNLLIKMHKKTVIAVAGLYIVINKKAENILKHKKTSKINKCLFLPWCESFAVQCGL